MMSLRSPMFRRASAVMLLALSPLGCSLLEQLPDDGPDEPEPAVTPTGKPHGKHHGKGKKKDDSPSPTASATPAKTAAPSPTTTAAPNKPASVHLTMGTPTAQDPSDDYLLVKPEFVVGYSHARNVPNWVSWNLNASYFGDAPRHKGKFLPDDTLPSGWYRAQDHDYSGSGYDRGHMVRSEERTRSPEDNLTTFHLTNVLPQYHDLNAGPWLRLEDYLQELSQRENKELYVVAGGIFAAKPKTIGHDLAVPDATYKIVVVLSRGQGLSDVTPKTRVIAVVMPNEKGILDEPWGKYRTKVSEVEKRSRHTFLTALPDAVKKALSDTVDDGPTGGAR
ncbi:MAG: DNA/RNA non-specific endonuclease [Polyangiaceae bacterium]